MFNGSLVETRTTTLLSQEDCNDDVGLGVNHPLFLNRYVNATSALQGTLAVGNLWDGSHFDHYVCDYHGSFSHDISLPVLSIADASTRSIARSNPSRTTLSPLELLQDLKELPRQLKDLGTLVQQALGKGPTAHPTIRELAGHNLGFQFGWIPLIGDVKSLLSFHSSVNKRAEELHRLYGKGGLRRRITLGSWSSSSEADKGFFQFGPDWLGVHQTFQSKADQWAVIRWKPSDLPPWAQTDAGINAQARKLVEGLTFEGFRHGLWNVIPWSWLEDWFSNMHDYIDAYSATCPAVVDSHTIMTHRVTTASNVRYKQFTPQVTGGDGVVTLETKERALGVAPSMTAHLPFISANQLSILGSLALQRFKRGGLLDRLFAS
jgi:hypothetical protein